MKKQTRLMPGGATEQRRRYFKKEARQTLFCGQHWACAVFAQVLCVFFAAGAKWLAGTLRALVRAADGYAAAASHETVFSVIAAIILFFATVPLLVGFFRYLSVIDKEPDGLSVAEVFYYFSDSAHLLRAYTLMLAVFWPLLPAAAAFLGLAELRRSTPWQGVLAPSAAAVCDGCVRALPYLVGALLLIAMMRRMAVFHLAARHGDWSARRCVARSARLSRGAECEMLGILLSFAGLFLLSACSLGVLFVLYVFPYFILSAVGLFTYLEARDRTD